MRSARSTIVLAAVLMLALYAAPSGASGTTLSARTLRNKASDNNGYNEPLCQSRTSLCIDSYDNPGDDYVGHGTVVELNRHRRALLPHETYVCDEQEIAR